MSNVSNIMSNRTCPRCNSRNYESTGMSFEIDGTIYERFKCLACKFEWKESCKGDSVGIFY